MTHKDPLYLSYSEHIFDVVKAVCGPTGCPECLARLLSHQDLRLAFEERAEDGPIPSSYGSWMAREYAKQFSVHQSAGAAWLQILGCLCGLLPQWPTGRDQHPVKLSVSAILESLAILRKHHPDLSFATGLIGLPIETTRRLRPLTQLLTDHKLLSPVEVLDIPEIIEGGRTPGQGYQDGFPNPKRLEWWFEVLNWPTLDLWFPVFKSLPSGTFAATARGLDSAIGNFKVVAHVIYGREDQVIHGWQYEDRVPAELATRLAPYLHEMFQRWESRPKDEELLWYCIRFASMVHGGVPASLDANRRKALTQASADLLGRLRTLTRQSDSPDAVREFSSRLAIFNEALLFIGRFGSIWPALKPLILAMRSLRTACVGADLWYWNEKENKPGPVWSGIPNLAAGLVHRFAGKEQQADPDLIGLRSEFAAFCLERLKTDSDGKLVEPNPHWRYGYVRALQDLRANPRGRGHHTLHHARKNDPDEAVREAAEAAYRELRHGEGLPENRSPRRAILGALWWVRRAHFIEHHGEAALDVRGSVRTRNRESRRTDLQEDLMEK